jgi:multiple sugar transport system permease protein
MTTAAEDIEPRNVHPKTGFVEPQSEKLPEPAAVTPRRGRRKEWLSAYLFLAPQLIGLILFMLGPLIFAVVLAFSNWDGFGNRSFAGFDNFVTVFTERQFLISARNTVWFTVLQVPGLMISAFFVAWMLQRAGRMKSIYRIFYFAPVVTSSVAVAAIWLWLFNPEISPVNNFLRSIGLPAPDWVQNPKTVIPAFAIVGIWQGLGYQVVMFMAGLENVPRSLYEAADIDGASEWQKMRKITIPLLSPTILFLSITSIIGSFQVFDYIYVFLETTAPEAARTIVYEIVQIAFREFNFGVGAALAVVLFLALLALTGLQMAAQKRWVHYTE